MQKQKMIKPLNGSVNVFRISKKRIESGVSKTNKSGKTFDLIEDLDSTKENYLKIVESLPARPGILIITGHYKNSQVTLEVVRSNESIRSAFFRPLKKNRLLELNDYIKNQLFDHITIQLAIAS
jgi:hypothetical protein